MRILSTRAYPMDVVSIIFAIIPSPPPPPPMGCNILARPTNDNRIVTLHVARVKVVVRIFATQMRSRSVYVARVFTLYNIIIKCLRRTEKSTSCVVSKSNLYDNVIYTGLDVNFRITGRAIV